MSISLEDIQLPKSASLMDAMNILNKGGAQIVLVVDDVLCLLGTLTDGDIRRGIISGVSLDSSVVHLMNTNFHFVPQGYDSQQAFDIMRRFHLRQLPVLDESSRPVDLLHLDDFLSPSELQNSVVIMAGGKGSRLRPYTEKCPKPMLLVDGSPMLEIILKHCITDGFRKFYISVNYLKEQIIEYFGDGSAWGVSIEYLIEGQPLGTAGSLKLITEQLQLPFVVMNGDVLTRFRLRQLIQFHAQHRAMATVCVREHTTTIPFGVVSVEGIELSGFEEKPTYRHLVNAGIYVIDPGLLELLPNGISTDMPSLLENAQIDNHRVVVCPIHEYWIDVGRPETLREAHQQWSLEGPA